MTINWNEQVNARRTVNCGHPKAGTELHEVTQLWCNDCKVVYNMKALDCGQKEFDELFKDWLVIGSWPNTRISRESGFYWIEGLLTGTPIIAYYDHEKIRWTIAGTTAALVSTPVVLSERLVFIPKANPEIRKWTTYLTASDLINGLGTLKGEDRKKPLRIELGLGSGRIMPFNAHDAWCEEDAGVIVLKIQ